MSQVGDPIEDFLNAYKELANSCGFTDHQKVNAVIRYIPFMLWDLWKSLDGYMACNWTALRCALEDVYEDPSALSRHLEKKLMTLVRLSSKLCMSNEEYVLEY